MSHGNGVDVPRKLLETVARHNLAVLQAVMRKAGVQELDIYYDSENGRRVVENAVCNGKDASSGPIFEFDVEGLQALEETPEGNDEEMEGWWRVPVATIPFVDAVRTVCFDLVSTQDPEWDAGLGTIGSVRVGLQSATVVRYRRLEEFASFEEKIEAQAAVLPDVESIGSDGWDGHWAAEVERQNFATVLACMAEMGVEEIRVELTKLPPGAGVARDVRSSPRFDAEDWPMIDQRVAQAAGESWTERQPLETAVVSLVEEEVQRAFPSWIGKSFTAQATVTSEGVRLNMERRKLERGTSFLRSPAPCVGLGAPEGAGPGPE